MILWNDRYLTTDGVTCQLFDVSSTNRDGALFDVVFARQ